MNGVYLGNNRVMVAPIWGRHLFVPADDLDLTPPLITYGVFEYNLTNYIQKILKEGDTVFDIGANIGYYTVLFGHLVGPKGKVIAYEANPNVFSFLKDNIGANFLVKQTKIFNKAIFSSKKKIKLNISPRYCGHGSIYNRSDDPFLKEFDETYDGEHSIVEIQAEPLDIYAEKFDKIDLIKMDIEGAEFHAFMGMKKLLNTTRVNQIVFEWNKKVVGKDAQKFYELLKEIRDTYDMSFNIIDRNFNLVPLSLDVIYQHEFIDSVVMKKNK